MRLAKLKNAISFHFYDGRAEGLVKLGFLLGSVNDSSAGDAPNEDDRGVEGLLQPVEERAIARDSLLVKRCWIVWGGGVSGGVSEVFVVWE
jgi:hypothetical protein